MVEWLTGLAGGLDGWSILSENMNCVKFHVLQRVSGKAGRFPTIVLCSGIEIVWLPLIQRYSLFYVVAQLPTLLTMYVTLGLKL